MSDLNSKKDEIRELAQFVSEEAHRTRTSVRNQLIILGAVTLLLIGYFAFLNSKLSQLTEPQYLAKHMVISIDDNVPEFGKLVEIVLTDSAPKVADFITDKVLQEGIPFLVKRSEDLLTMYIKTLSQSTADNLSVAFSEVVKNNKDAIQKSAEEGVKSDDWPANALRPLRDNLHARLKTNKATGKRTEAMDAIAKSEIALRNLNKRLQALASKNPDNLTRKEQLGSRLLKVYWRYNNSRGPSDVESKQMGGQGKYAGEGSMDPNNLE